MQLANISNDPQKIYSGTLAAKCEPVEIMATDVISHPKEKQTNVCIDTLPKYGHLASTFDGQWSFPAHLEYLFNVSRTELSENETEVLGSLLWKHADAISKHEGDISFCTLVKHRINTGNTNQIKQAPWRLRS